MDRVTVEVVEALQAAGIPCIVLKGPAIARRLYVDSGRREYIDTDLLIEPSRVSDAKDLLKELGFDPHWDPRADRGAHSGDYAETLFRRRDGVEVDLHRSLPGVGAPPEVVWALLTLQTDRLRFRDAEVRVLGAPAFALHLALHAAQHGPGASKQREDLARGLDQLDEGVWAAAAELAEILDALPAFVSGLRLSPRGRGIAGQLRLRAVPTTELEINARSSFTGAGSIERLASTPGLRRKLAFVRAKVFPSRSYMGYWSPFKRLGRVGLPLAYAWRPVWVVLRLPGALRGWFSARRRARDRSVAVPD